MAVLLLLSLRTHDQGLYWQDPWTLWAQTLQTSDNHPRVQGMVGTFCVGHGQVLLRQGKPGDAVSYFQRAAELLPSARGTVDPLLSSRSEWAQAGIPHLLGVAYRLDPPWTKPFVTSVSLARRTRRTRATGPTWPKPFLETDGTKGPQSILNC